LATVCRISKTLPVNDELHAIVRGLFKVNIIQLEAVTAACGPVENIEETSDVSPEIIALGNRAVSEIKRAQDLGKRTSTQVFSQRSSAVLTQS
jgi:hypothetical protein